jgi:hypothetical protein
MKRALILIFLFVACHREAAQHDAAMPMTMMPRVNPNAPILAASSFANPIAADAYAKASQVPDRLSHLYCYCHCHQHLGHDSLKTCFQTDHAAECQVCQREAVQAWQDWKNGLPVEASQRWADAAYNGGAPPPQS